MINLKLRTKGITKLNSFVIPNCTYRGSAVGNLECYYRNLEYFDDENISVVYREQNECLISVKNCNKLVNYLFIVRNPSRLYDTPDFQIGVIHHSLDNKELVIVADSDTDKLLAKLTFG